MENKHIIDLFDKLAAQMEAFMAKTSKSPLNAMPEAT